MRKSLKIILINSDNLEFELLSVIPFFADYSTSPTIDKCVISTIVNNVLMLQKCNK